MVHVNWWLQWRFQRSVTTNEIGGWEWEALQNAGAKESSLWRRNQYKSLFLPRGSIEIYWQNTPLLDWEANLFWYLSNCGMQIMPMNWTGYLVMMILMDITTMLIAHEVCMSTYLQIWWKFYALMQELSPLYELKVQRRRNLQKGNIMCPEAFHSFLPTYTQLQDISHRSKCKSRSKCKWMYSTRRVVPSSTALLMIVFREVTLMKSFVMTKCT